MMVYEGLPNDRRNFVHKRFIRAATSFVTSGFNPLAAVGSFVAAAPRPSGRSGGSPAGAVFSPPGQRGTRLGAGFASRGNCRVGTRRIDGVCQRPTPGVVGALQRLIPGGATGTEPIPAGEAVMGRFGAALEPSVEGREVRTCLPGMVLGEDGLCYNRRDIRNSERMYPKGTRPLGTPGEMACLRKAASFGRRMETTVKRMQKIGVLKKPASRKAARAPKMQTDGVRVVNVE